MTGYGKSVLQLANKTISIEIKSLNSKSLDLNMRMPSAYRSKELDLRKSIAAKLSRGKVDFSLYVDTSGQETHTNVNATVVNKYIEQLETVSTGTRIEFLQMAIKMPDAISTERDDVDEDEWGDIYKEIHKAIENISLYRLEEGKVLEADFKDHRVFIGFLRDFEILDDNTQDQPRIKFKVDIPVFDISLDLNWIYDKNKFDSDFSSEELVSNFLETLKPVNELLLVEE